MKITTTIHNIAERIAYWALRQILTGYAKVFASGLAQLQYEQHSFRDAAIQVGNLHTAELVSLRARIAKLEAKGSTVCE